MGNDIVLEEEYFEGLAAGSLEDGTDGLEFFLVEGEFFEGGDEAGVVFGSFADEREGDYSFWWRRLLLLLLLLLVLSSVDAGVGIDVVGGLCWWRRRRRRRQ